MNQRYWEEFYSKKHVLEPTPFAKYCAGIIPKDMPIIDLGCGNGRDSYYFAEQGHRVLGLDSASKPENRKNVEFLQADIGELLHRTGHKDACLYSRFFLHAIKPKELDRLLDWTTGLFLAEMRSKDDKSFIKDHRRNLIDGKKFLPKLIKKGFHTFTYQEGKGMAIFKDQDPTVIRVVALK